MRERFWAFAHRHYHGKKPGRLVEAAFLVWGVFFVLVYVSAIVSGWVPQFGEAILGIVLTAAPIIIGLGHWRIRAEAAKGGDALYRKLLAVRREAPR